MIASVRPGTRTANQSGKRNRGTGLAETGLTETSLTETSLAETSLAETGPAGTGLAETNPERVGFPHWIGWKGHGKRVICTAVIVKCTIVGKS